MTVAENVETLLQPHGGNYEMARFNALRHGVLWQYTVLPWEDGAEYDALIEALAEEHSPRGPTEEHLVEELVGIIWRKRRLRQAEAAAHHRALRRTTDSYQETAKAAVIHVAGHQTAENQSVDDAIRATEEQTARDRADLEADQAMTEEGVRADREAFVSRLFVRAGCAARGHPRMLEGAAQLEARRLRGRGEAVPGRYRAPPRTAPWSCSAKSWGCSSSGVKTRSSTSSII
jgi:hypothetical protein